MMRALSASALRIHASARSGGLICSTIRITCSLAQPLPGGDQRRHLGREADRLADGRLARVVLGVGIERLQGGDARAQHLHGRRLLRELAQDGDELGGELPVDHRGQGLDVRVEILAAGQVAVPEEIDDLLERGGPDQVVDVVAAVEQPPFPPVDETDLRSRDDDVFEAFLEAAHGLPSPGVWKRFAFIIARRALQGGPAMNVTDFYDRHPINERQALAAIARRRGTAAGPLKPEDLFDYDQDHYGGLAAGGAPPPRAALRAGPPPLGRWAGLGGPAAFPGSPLRR